MLSGRANADMEFRDEQRIIDQQMIFLGPVDYFRINVSLVRGVEQ